MNSLRSVDSETLETTEALMTEKINIFTIARMLQYWSRLNQVSASSLYAIRRRLILVLITGTQIRIINPSYVRWVCSGSGDEYKPNFLTPDAEKMLDGIEKALNSSAEVTFLELARTGREKKFWYSRPYFDPDLLIWDSYITADEVGSPAREILDRLWSSDYEILDKKALRHVSPYIFAHERRRSTFSRLWHHDDEHEIGSSGQFIRF